MISGIILIISLILFITQYYLDGKKILFFNPKNLFQIYFIIQLPLVLFIGVNFNIPGYVALSKNYPVDGITFLGTLILSGQIAFLVGYYAIEKSRLSINLTSFRWRHRRVKLITAFIFLIGYISFYYLIKINGGYGQFIANRGSWRAGGLEGQGWLIFPATTMLTMGAVSILISENQLFKGKNGFIYFIMLAIATVLPASQMGFRGLILLPILQMLMAYNYRVHQLKLKEILPSLLFILIFFTIYGIYRKISVIMIDGYNYHDFIKYAESNPELIFDIFMRSKGADVLAVVVNKTNGISDFKLFYPSIIETSTIMIPHFIWANKPIPLSVQFSEHFFGIGGGISPTVVGEAYWNMGYIGVLIVLFSLGIFFGLYRNLLVRNQTNNSFIFLSASIFPSLIMLAEAVQGYLNGMIMMLTIGCGMIFIYSARIFPKKIKTIPNYQLNK